MTLEGDDIPEGISSAVVSELGTGYIIIEFEGECEAEERKHITSPIKIVGENSTYIVGFSSKKAGTRFYMCNKEGTTYSNTVVSDTAPSDTTKKWVDTSSSPHSLRIYSSAQNEWVSVATTYIKICATDIGRNFNVGDGVLLSGIKGYTMPSTPTVSEYEGYWGFNTDLDEKYSIIQAKDKDYIVVIGILDYKMQQGSQLTVKKTMPDMDLVFECNNRLWGCKGNEIYASKLGDPTNWNVFEGVSTDSYVLSTGSNRLFTGACVYNGSPLFFREDELIKIYGDYPANFQTQTIACDGVKNGCENSLVFLNGSLFYYSTSGMAVYSGTYPININEVFGDKIYSNAMGVSLGNKLYIVMTDDSTSEQVMFEYDIKKSIWHKRESFQGVVQLFKNNDNIIIVADSQSEDGVKIAYTLESREAEYTPADKSTLLNEKVKWFYESGNQTASLVDHKYVQKILIRMHLPVGSKMRVYISYDGGEYSLIYNAMQVSLNTFELPIKLKRCDYYRLKIEGEGDCNIYSITKTIIQGSDRH